MRLTSTILLLFATALSGCNGGTTNVNSNSNSNTNAPLTFKPPQAIKPAEAADPNFKPCNPYFPLVPGSIAKYVITFSSGLIGDMTVVVDAADENGRKVFIQRSQLVDRSGGLKQNQTIVRRFVCDGDRVQILSEKTETNAEGQVSSSEFEFRENSLVMTDPRSVLIKGSKWTHVFRTVFHSPGQPPARSDQPTAIAFETGSPETVTTAIGTFKGVPISRKIGDNLTVDHYVAGLGLVKRVSKEGTSWELKEYSGLKPQD